MMHVGYAGWTSMRMKRYCKVRAEIRKKGYDKMRVAASSTASERKKLKVT